MKIINQGIVIISLIVAFLIPLPAYAASEVPNEVLSAAQEGIQIFVKNLPPQKLPRFGFLSQEDIDNETLDRDFSYLLSFLIAS